MHGFLLEKKKGMQFTEIYTIPLSLSVTRTDSHLHTHVISSEFEGRGEREAQR